MKTDRLDALLFLAPALLAATSLCAAAERCPQVMDPELPTGTIRMFEPGHPMLADVSSTSEPGLTTVIGSLEAPQGVYEPGTPEYSLCRESGANCRIFTASLPDGSVVGGPVQYAVRAKGASTWTQLSARRQTLVRGPDNVLVKTGAYTGEYEEFPGFSIEPYFLTLNCAVSCREATRWEVRLWRAQAIEFRIAIPTQRCPTIRPGEDAAD